MQRFIAAFDNHGDMADPGALAAFFDFLEHWKPEIRIHGGDCFDFRALRRGASEEELRDGLTADYDAGCIFIERFRPTHWTRGNHDERLYDRIGGDDRMVAGYCKDLADGIAEVTPGCQILPYHKRNGVLTIGHLKVIHGYHAGVTAARQAALVYGSVLMGHVHTIDVYSIPGIERRVGRVCGALCRLDMDYNRAQPSTLRHAHGWAYGVLFPSGAYQCWQAETVDGQWVFPSEIYSYAN